MNQKSDWDDEQSTLAARIRILSEKGADLYWLTPRDKTMIRDLRYLMRENQTEFWNRFGVGQSSGSRLERGMAVPLPVLLLIRLYFLRIVTDEDLQKVRSDEYESGALHWTP